MRRCSGLAGVVLAMGSCGPVNSETPRATVPGTVPSPALTGGPMPLPESVLPDVALQILCLISDPQARRDRDGVALCDAAAAVARSLTDRPVEIIQVGDPAVVRPGSTTLFLHAAVQRLDGEALLLISARTARVGGPAGELFGPPPRATRLGPDLAASAEPALRDLIAPLLGRPVASGAVSIQSTSS